MCIRDSPRPRPSRTRCQSQLSGVFSGSVPGPGGLRCARRRPAPGARRGALLSGCPRPARPRSCLSLIHI
eukprot:12400921-Alexandrium_andersonii.AAC.1